MSIEFEWWTNVLRGMHPTSVLATMVVLMLIVAVPGRDWYQAPTVAKAAQGSDCTNGIVVPEPANYPGLVSDCQVLLAARDILAGTATLNWSVSRSIENWEGVYVSGLDPRVTGIDLWDRSLSGEIPSTFGSLAYLEHLLLGANQLTGAIPAELGQLSKLELLSLGQNQLSGVISPDLGSLTELTWLSLAQNQLEGSIPVELGNLSNLEELDLWRNGLTGPIPPEIGALSKLYWISLGENRLTGSIPTELGNLSNLEVLHLSGNELTGEIPPAIGSLSELTFLSLDTNQLTGPIPASLGRLSKLSVLYLGYSELTGPIPAQLGILSNLRILDLRGNALTGEIPSSLGNLSGLEELYLSNNQLTGPIPYGLGELLNLQVLQISGNRLTGCIPERLLAVPDNDLGLVELPYCTAPETWDCSTGIAVRDPAGTPGLVSDCEALLTVRDTLAGTASLNWSLGMPIRRWEGIFVGNLVSSGQPRVTDIVLNEMGLNGELYSSLGSLTHLTSLHINHNHLTGPIPSDLGRLVNLEELFLEGNRLSGPIPTELGQLSSLTELNLGHNQLTGPVPSELGSLSNLQDLYLQVNGLDGPIPPEIFELTNLRNLYLSENQLSGAISTDLVQLSELESLNLSHNQLTGTIPIGLSNLSELKLLSLAGNQLEGPIPSELGGLSHLEHLGLVGSGLTGPIPLELGNLSSLKWLSLAQNGLTGSIPSELGSLTNLEEFYLGGNELTGVIPSEFGGLSRLQILDLGHNQLTDEIPRELGNLSELVRLYLSDNELTGTIPEELGNLISLQYLHLAHNRLTGSIPSDLGMLTQLKEMDLSENQLSGQVPPELGGLADLELLDLTGNQFTGCIPPGLLDEATDYLYMQGLFACEATRPEPPFIRRPVFTEDSLILSWPAPLRIGSSPIIAYDLRYINASMDKTVTSNWTLIENVWTIGSGDLRYELTDLTDGTTYDVQIRGMNDAGYSDWSRVLRARPGRYLASRSLSLTRAEPDGEIVVTIAAGGYGQFGAIHETLPDGSSYISSSLSEHAVSVEGSEIRFILFLTSEFTYTMTAPSTDGIHTFSGSISNHRREAYEIDGTQSIIVQRVPVVELSYSIGSDVSPVRVGHAIPITATFNEPVTGFTVEDLTVTNGSADNFVGSDGDMVYTFDVTPDAIGNVTVDILSGVAGDSVGYGNEPAHISLGIPYDDDRDGIIGSGEVLEAVSDYFNGDLSGEHVLELVRLYFASSD